MHKLCTDYANIMRKLCRNNAEIMHNYAEIMQKLCRNNAEIMQK